MTRALVVSPLLALALIQAGHAQWGRVIRLTAGAVEGQALVYGGGATITPSKRYVVFTSEASENSYIPDHFRGYVRFDLTAESKLTISDWTGELHNHGSYPPFTAADGSKSIKTITLTQPSQYGTDRAVLLDWRTRTAYWADIDSNGYPPEFAYAVGFDPDGETCLLIAGYPMANGNLDTNTFRRDLRTGALSRALTFGWNPEPSVLLRDLSADRSRALMSSEDPRFSPGAQPSATDLFAIDLLTLGTRRITVRPDETNPQFERSGLTSDGRRLRYRTRAPEPRVGDIDDEVDAFEFDLRTSVVSRMDRDVWGNKVGEWKGNLESDFALFVRALDSRERLAFVKNLATGMVKRIDLSPDRAEVPSGPSQSWSGSTAEAVSEDGTVTLFFSYRGGLTPGDDNDTGDLYARIQDWIPNPAVLVRQDAGARHLGWQPFEDGRITGWGNTGATPPGWELAATGDLDFNGTDDLIWVDQAQGRWMPWMMDGYQRRNTSQSFPLSPGWSIVGAADLDGNKAADVVLRNDATGALGCWTIRPPALEQVAISGWRTLPRIAAGWRPVGFADFDSDDRPDLLVQHADGRLGAYLLRDFRITGWRSLPRVPAGWRIGGLGDFDGSPDKDILQRRESDGAYGAWLMEAGVATRWKQLGRVAPGWSMVGVATFI